MCVIAGYVGKRLASPVLLEMIERQEGLNAGYYSGVAVVEPGSLHWRKVVGLMADLRKAILRALSQGEAREVEEMGEIAKRLSRRPDPKVFYDPVFDVLYRLIRSGEIRREVKLMPGDPQKGDTEGLMGLRFVHSLPEH